MSTLKLIKDAVTGNISGASIDDKIIDGFISVNQTLERGTLRAVITVNFDSVEVVDAMPTPAPALVATFAEGTAEGSTKATITDMVGAGNHFAYKVATAAVTKPNVGDVIDGTVTYTSGNDITGVDASSNKYLGLYELTTDNKAVKFLAHTVVTGEIKSAAI